MSRRGLWLAAAFGALATILVVAPAPASIGAALPKSPPGNFAQVMGYTPVSAQLADGSTRLVNPDGGCSVPGEGRPFDFAVPCQAHDYGYDLLRYAERTGHPLAPGARDTLDEALAADLRTQCLATTAGTELAACTATVDLFAAGVDFNSWRQMSGPPVDLSGMPRTTGLVLLGLMPFGFVTRRLRRRAARSDRSATTPAPAAC
ncbi:hypothetical protein F4553_004081 [Allocatelliglobosispora scoriae]|uniref:Phospholipase n=1 Tax=Allocatelliglobosispora scoriae TaxID=643052 RepID=A0A841BVB9_9ACTN|nr:phospholipase A2 [Allocatelliglobosispora scoriae]MBB5870702.1 hypothetical protein [Allocatelliglobosispora scoriae]